MNNWIHKQGTPQVCIWVSVHVCTHNGSSANSKTHKLEIKLKPTFHKQQRNAISDVFPKQLLPLPHCIYHCIWHWILKIKWKYLASMSNGLTVMVNVAVSMWVFIFWSKQYIVEDSTFARGIYTNCSIFQYDSAYSFSTNAKWWNRIWNVQIDPITSSDRQTYWTAYVSCQITPTM